VRRRARRLLGPELLDEAVDRYRLACAQQEGGQHGALLGAAQRQLPSAGMCLQRPEDPELDVRFRRDTPNLSTTAAQTEGPIRASCEWNASGVAKARSSKRPKEDHMRSTASLLFAVALATVAVATAACGGSSSASDPLMGTWAESPGDMLIRFDDDGTFVVDADGSLEDGVFTGGSYKHQGPRVSFTMSKQGMCRGDKLAWRVAFVKDDAMDVEVVDGGCYMEKGFRTKLVRSKES
jgi:hypothetical protein